MINLVKKAVAVTAIAVGIAVFGVFGSAFAYDNSAINGNHNGDMSGKANGNAEGRGTANFTMSFSGSATTRGNFDADGMTQNMFYGNGYSTQYYGNAPYYAPAK